MNASGLWTRIGERIGARPIVPIFLAIALLVASLSLAIHNERLNRLGAVRGATVQAQILANSIAAPLAFDDRSAEHEYLAALQANQNIEAVGLYDAAGRLAASFARAGAAVPAANHVGSPLFDRGDLVVTAPVVQGATKLGSVHLRVAMETWPHRALRYLGIALVVIMACLLVAVLGASFAAASQAHRKLREEIEGREKAEAALRQAQKMEAMGRLTGGIAHDLNNMLQGIGGSLELMQRRIARGRPEEAELFLGEAQKAVARAAGLTSHLLAFARRQALAPKPVDLDEMFEGTVELIRRAVGPQIVVELEKHDGKWNVLCDPNQLESAILNLTINARDAMPDGGRLSIETNDVTLAAGELVDYEDVSPGDYVTVTVSDTGAGMPQDVLTRAFEPFFTTKPLGRGTGLGLSQVYGFLRQSGGFVRLESVEGKGTSVRMFLPPYRGTIERPPTPKTQRPHVEATGVTILVVEDEPSVRAMVVEAAREIGCTVLEAVDGPNGLKMLDASDGIDVLVTDVGLPGLNGRKLADAARERLPNLPILFITSYAGEALDHWQLAAGMELLPKPFTLELFADRLAKIISTTR